MTLIHASALLVLFLILLALEMFIPSGGLLGIAAAASLIAAIVIGFMHSLAVGAALLVSAAFVVPLLISVGLRIWPRTPIGKRMLTIDPEEDLQRESELREKRDALMGKTGIAQTDMLPSGLVEVDGQRLDAVSVGMAIDRGTAIEIVSVDAGKIRVRPFDGNVTTKRDPNPSASTPAGLETPIEQLGLEDWN